MIAIHALTGIQSRFEKTMQVFIDINDVLLTTLLDSGSTHNFIDTEATTRAGITLGGRSSLRIVVANGDQLQSLGHCRGLSVSIRGRAVLHRLLRAHPWFLPHGTWRTVVGIARPYTMALRLAHTTIHPERASGTLVGLRNGPGATVSAANGGQRHGQYTPPFRVAVHRACWAATPPQLLPPHLSPARHDACRDLTVQSESASWPLVDFGVLNDNLIK
jgi:hypothetical protein